MLNIQRVNIDYQYPEPGKVSCLIYGNPKDKPILALHGITHNAKFFEFFAIEAVKKGFCIYAPDLPGRGESSYFQKSRNYNYENYVSVLKVLLDNLNLYNPVILASSMGGLLSMMFLRTHYYNFSKLILNDIGYYIPGEIINKVGYYFKPKPKPYSKNEIIDKISKEFSQSNLDEIGLKFLFQIYTKHVGGDEYIFNYDSKLCDAFWRGEKQKNLPDMNYIELWQALCEVYKDKEIYIMRGENSKFFQKETFDEMIKSPLVKDKYVAENVGHLPLMLKKPEIEKVLNFSLK